MFRGYGYKIYPFLIGAGASLGLIAFYLGIMTLTADWYYATIQFEQYRWWIIALSLGLGVQSTLFTLLRRGLKGAEKKTAKSTLEWKESPLGGHHRRGILEFPKLEGNPQSVKLLLRGIAGVSERSFEWKIGS
jgi:hypothetical protein